MKKNLIVFLCFILIIPFINSCKKGDEDPFISLRSRESRLKGKWKLTSGTVTLNQNSVITTKTFTESMVTVTTNGQSTIYTHTEDLEFLKDNVFKATKMNDNNIETDEGFWTFIDGNGNGISDKECVVLRFTSVITGGNIQTYTGDEMPINIIRLKKLSNKELIIEIDGSTIYSSTSTTTLIKTYDKE